MASKAAIDPDPERRAGEVATQAATQRPQEAGRTPLRRILELRWIFYAPVVNYLG
ncbi:MAG: hypothetical protein NNA21_00595 [Nitrospira sp.]|nr:hypothetical protein [Nitrospira sp.]MCP9461842.1 hypothetical protein [Nitrospira sp.]MCP9475607.1 hypothetical protein [Nitrospira sp.]